MGKDYFRGRGMDISWNNTFSLLTFKMEKLLRILNISSSTKSYIFYRTYNVLLIEIIVAQTGQLMLLLN